MAAAFTITASALSVPNALSSRGGAAGLSSGNAFQKISVVQKGPVTSRAHRMVAARASLGAKASKAAARREVLASILAAGAAVGFGGRAVADPIEDAKKKAESAKQIVDEKAPKLPDAKSQIEEAKKKVAGSLDKVSGKVESASVNFTPSSGPGTTNFRQSFGNLAVETPSVEDVKSATSDAKSSTESAKSGLQSKGSDLVGQAKDATPDLPKTSSLPDLPKVDLPKVDFPKVELPKFGK